MPRDDDGRHVTAAVTAEPDWREAGRVARSEAWALREQLRVMGERETEARAEVARLEARIVELEAALDHATSRWAAALASVGEWRRPI